MTNFEWLTKVGSVQLVTWCCQGDESYPKIAHPEKKVALSVFILTQCFFTVDQHSCSTFCCDKCRPRVYYRAPEATLFTSCCPCLAAPYGMKRSQGWELQYVSHNPSPKSLLGAHLKKKMGWMQELMLQLISHSASTTQEPPWCVHSCMYGNATHIIINTHGKSTWIWWRWVAETPGRKLSWQNKTDGFMHNVTQMSAATLPSSLIITCFYWGFNFSFNLPIPSLCFWVKCDKTYDKITRVT